MSPVRVRFSGCDRDLEVELGESLLDAALRQGVAIDHACGGVCACSTCHIKITRGAEALSAADEDELDQLDTARGVGLNSRLACQAKVERRPEGGVVEAEIPRWNVNLVREGS
ncbi:MAG: 2Fe-2S iron-sulfur cluster-binding protein [Planctomycetota bacterium]